MRRILILLAAFVMAMAVAPSAGAGGHQHAAIIRDEYGVPHIYARTTEALFYGMGYVAADDRLWQAEIHRRSATGTLAELFGPDVLAQDVEARTIFGSADERGAALAAASPETQLIFSSYVAGMNARIEEEARAGTLPAEFGAVGPPRPWVEDDAVATFMLLGSQFGWFGSNELDNLATWAALEGALGADAATVFGDLFWLDDPDAPTTVPSGPSHAGRRGAAPTADYGSGAAVAANDSLSGREAAQAAREHVGLVLDGPASNAMVVSGKLTRSGSPLLLGGPQMGYGTPQINHEVGLHGAGYDVTGMTIAGFPLVPIGVGDGYAWTLTSGGSDNTDIYAEVLDPADPTKYLYNGEWVPMECRLDEIGVAGLAPVSQPICSTVHGPVIGVSDTTAFTLKSVAFGHELDSFAGWGSLAKAGSIDDFAAALDDVAYNFNVLYADRAGNIAYWHIGHIPVRAEGVNPFFPASGTGEAEWQGILPFSENPQAINPRQGWMTSWNNKPEAGWANSTADFWLWGGAHRVNTLMNQLEQLKPHTATMKTLERFNRIGGWTTDTPTGQASSVFVSSDLDMMLRAVDVTADPRLRRVVKGLHRWKELQTDRDGDGYYDNPWGTIFNAWWTQLSSSVFDEVDGVTNRFILGNLVHRMLLGDRAGLPLGYDYLGGESVTAAVTAALVGALDQLESDYGSARLREWMQPISTIDWAPIPLTPGVGSTIWMNRGTYNQIVSLARWIRAENVIAPGQSGEATSPHFSDQLALYANWNYKPMRLTRRSLRGVVESIVWLTIP